IGIAVQPFTGASMSNVNPDRLRRACRLGVRGLTVTALAVGTFLMLEVSAAAAKSDPRTPASFVGSWYVHDGRLTVGPRLTGMEEENGGGVIEADVLPLCPAYTHNALVAVITKVSFVSASTRKPVANPPPNDSQAVGDSFRLT